MGSSPRSIRFDESVSARLTSYVSAHPGWSGSSVANRMVDEGLRMEDHPGVMFREGPAGRRAVLVGGPDVHEVIRALLSARESEPDLVGDDLLDVVSSNTGVSVRLIRIALRYWAAYADEIDAWIADTQRFEDESHRIWQREQDLLAR